MIIARIAKVLPYKGSIQIVPTVPNGLI